MSDAGSAVELRLSGSISELAELSTLPEKVPAGRPVILDTGEVESINSLGVRDWVGFVRALCERSPQVTIRRLSPPLVIQANAIYDFLSRARVESFICAWECTKCGNWHETLHALHEDPGKNLACPKCGSPMAFWDLEEGYLSFRSAAK